MKEESLTKSYVSNLIATILSLIIPIITVPYITRCLGPELYGTINFALAIVTYFSLIVVFGLSIFGMREIAKNKESKEKISQVFIRIQSILLFNLIIVTIVYVFIISKSNLHYDYKLYYILYFQIFAESINSDWVFRGLQKYATVTKIYILIKLLNLILIFVFVQGKVDFYIYAIITVTCLIIQSLLFLIESRKLIDFRIKYLYGIFFFIRENIKSIMYLFAANISTQIYVNIDIIMIGIIKGNLEVGYYTAATKIIRVLIAILTASGPIMLTKISGDYNSGQNIKKTLKKSFAFNYMLSIPVTIGGFLIANDLIYLFLGNEFEPAIITFKVLIFLPLIISSTYFITAQILIPLGMDKLFFWATLITSVCNFLINLVLIPLLGGNGAAISTIIAETILFIVCFIKIPNDFKEIFNLAYIKDYIIGSMLFSVFIILNNIFNPFIILRIATNLLIAVLSYCLYLTYKKNELFIQILNGIK